MKFKYQCLTNLQLEIFQLLGKTQRSQCNGVIIKTKHAIDTNVLSGWERPYIVIDAKLLRKKEVDLCINKVSLYYVLVTVGLLRALHASINFIPTKIIKIRSLMDWISFYGCNVVSRLSIGSCFFRSTINQMKLTYP
jgi:hypothetical protein